MEESNTGKEGNVRGTVWGLVGFGLGCLAVIAATGVALALDNLPFSLRSILRVQYTNPLLWIINLSPLILAYTGWREGSLNPMRQKARQDAHRWEQEVSGLNAALEKKRQEFLDCEAQHAIEFKHLEESLDLLQKRGQEIEKAIGRAKRQWEATFDSVQDAIFITNSNQAVMRCNSVAAKMFQMTYNQIIGKPVSSLIRPDKSNADTIVLLPHKKQMQIAGLPGWYEVSSFPLEIDQEWAGNIYFLRDITEIKQNLLSLQLQKGYYELLLKSSPVAAVTLKMDHKVVECNPAFEALFGYSLREVVGKDLDNLILPEALIAEGKGFTHKVVQGNPVHALTHRKSKFGELIEVELFGAPLITRERQIGILALYHDVRGLVQSMPESEERAIVPSATHVDVHSWGTAMLEDN